MVRPRWLLLLAASPLLGGCPPPGAAPRPGRTVDCGGVARPVLDCASEVAYDGLRVEGQTSVLNLGRVQGATERVAIHRINAEVERYVAAQTRLCREYNACVVSAEEYSARAEELSRRLLPVGDAVAAMNAATGYRERQAPLLALYDDVVPAAARPEEITLRLTVEAELPASVGGGRARVLPGEELPTNARVVFTLEVSRPAYVYVFQRSPSGEPAVLFPDARIGLDNPLPAGVVQRIPPGAERFRVNERDLGEERVYLVASVEPLSTLDGALARVAAGAVKDVAASPELSALAALPPRDPGDCAPPAAARGLELAPGSRSCSRGLELAPAAAAAASLAARTDPGDSVIVKAFPFQHVTEAAYRGAARPAAPAAAPPTTRGPAFDEEEPLQR